MLSGSRTQLGYKVPFQRALSTTALSQGAALRVLVALGAAAPRGGQWAIHPNIWNLPKLTLPQDTDLPLQLLTPPEALTPVYPSQRDHFTDPTPPPQTRGVFFSRNLDLRCTLIYYAESQTSSSSKKRHFSSAQVPLHHPSNARQEHASEASQLITSTSLSSGPQPGAVVVHETRMPLR